MKKFFISLVILSSFALNLFATQEHKEEGRYYVAVKALMTLGDTVQHGTSQLSGATGKGLGIDLGYKLGNGFAVEIDATYAKNDITERDELGDEITVNASYMTSSLDIAYAYPITHVVELFVKGGYEYEVEKINDLGIDASDTGFIYAAGVEYELDEHISLIGEYEGTTINGPRGNSIFAGAVYHF